MNWWEKIDTQVRGRGKCKLLAVLCGEFADKPRRHKKQQHEQSPSFPLPELTSSGRLEVNVLVNPSIDEFKEAQLSIKPNLLYVRGEQFEDEEEIGSLFWDGVDVSDPGVFSSIVGPSLPTIIYLEVPNGDAIAKALQLKGILYVIYWKSAFSFYAASHFRQALFSVIQSSVSHTWDAFQLAHASFLLYCARNNNVSPSRHQKFGGSFGPCLLGNAPKTNIPPKDLENELEETMPDKGLGIKVYGDDVDMRFLLCGLPCTLDACLLGSFEDGLNALLKNEIRGSKLQSRISALPPPLQVGTLSREVVTMRCDLVTSSLAHISLLVSGSPQTCFDDALLHSHIKDELIERNQLVHALPSEDSSEVTSCEPHRSLSLACGASTFEVRMKGPSWTVQVLKHLALEVGYRSLVALGVAGINGTPVASFEKEDTERFIFFCNQREKNSSGDKLMFRPPSWSVVPVARRMSPAYFRQPAYDHNRNGLSDIRSLQVMQRSKPAALRPIPRPKGKTLRPFAATRETRCRDQSPAEPHIPVLPPVKHSVARSGPAPHRKPASRILHVQQIISLNSMPVLKHDCKRAPIQVCSEEEFLEDVIQFLILRGHNRLVPEGGVSEFPDAILNSKRLDLFNLYKEVVSRGGFYVGNGINWKGQVFSKMRNHTVSNRMTGVGNSLKRHYQTYLLEYELAHDDVDGECCILCHSGAPGDWVNCGLCGEWAHLGCDQRQGLGAFKDYAKSDGLEYICPRCSLEKSDRRPRMPTNGFF